MIHQASTSPYMILTTVKADQIDSVHSLSILPSSLLSSQRPLHWTSCGYCSSDGSSYWSFEPTHERSRRTDIYACESPRQELGVARLEGIEQHLTRLTYELSEGAADKRSEMGRAFALYGNSREHCKLCEGPRC